MSSWSQNSQPSKQATKEEKLQQMHANIRQKYIAAYKQRIREQIGLASTNCHHSELYAESTEEMAVGTQEGTNIATNHHTQMEGIDLKACLRDLEQKIFKYFS